MSTRVDPKFIAPRGEMVVLACPDCKIERTYRTNRRLTFMEARMRCPECGFEFWLHPDMVPDLIVPDGAVAVCNEEQAH